MTADAYRGNAADPAPLNGCQYADASPTMLGDPSGHCPVCIFLLANPVTRGALIGATIYVVGKIGTNLLYDRPVFQGIEGRELVLAAAAGAATGGLSAGLSAGIGGKIVFSGVTAIDAATVDWIATGGFARSPVPEGQDLTQIVVKGVGGSAGGAAGENAAGAAIAIGAEIGQNIIIDAAGASAPTSDLRGAAAPK